MNEAAAITAAKDATTLLANLQAAGSPMADSLKAKSLIGSRTVWYPLLMWVVTWLASHYGLGLDNATDASAASLLSYGVVVACRRVTRSPIGSFLPASAAPITEPNGDHP